MGNVDLKHLRKSHLKVGNHRHLQAPTQALTQPQGLLTLTNNVTVTGNALSVTVY